MEDLEAILARNALDVEVERADANPAMPNAAEGMTHWLVRIRGARVPFAFPVSILREDGGDEPPTAAEALTFLAADLRRPGLDEPDEDWLASVGGEDDAPAWLAARTVLLALADDLRALPAELRQALAPDAASASPAP